MKKITYSATAPDGRPQTGFIDAVSNREALAQLSQKGLTGIQLHDDAAFTVNRDDLAHRSDAELQTIARLELKLRHNASTLRFLGDVLVQSKLLLAIGGALIGWGLYSDLLWLWIAGVLVAAGLPTYALVNFQNAKRYDALLRAGALGQYDRVRQLVTELQPRLKAPEMAFDLAVRNACAMKNSAPLEAALASVEPWRASLEATSPGMYEGQLAQIHHGYGDYDGYLQRMRDAFAKSVESPTLVVDLALAEARFGDSERAVQLLDELRPEELPPHGQPFIHWARGMVAKRRGAPQAAEHLGSALTGLQAFAENPAVWTSLALCAGGYATVVDDEASIRRARTLLALFGRILTIHGDQPLLDELKAKYPGEW